MTGPDIRKLVKYLYNVESKEFARDIYDRDDEDSYTLTKFKLMQTKTMLWIGELDEVHMARLAQKAEEFEG